MQKSAGHYVCHGRHVRTGNPVNIFFRGLESQSYSEGERRELSPFADAHSVRQIRMRIVNAWPGKSFASLKEASALLAPQCGCELLRVRRTTTRNVANLLQICTSL
jgi:hypothetical protein